MADSDSRPTTAPPSGGAPGGGAPCRSCGWPNPPQVVRCEFCAVPLAQEAAPPRPRSVVCVQCGAPRPANPGLACPKCGQRAGGPPGPAERGRAGLADALSRFRISGPVLLVVLVVGAAMVGLRIQLRGQARMSTADHVRQIKQVLVIYAAQFGGFPANLELLQSRLGPIPAAFLRDAWDNPIRYDVSQPLGPSQESGGEMLFRRCELRSAGPNEDLGDGDDITWSGSADDGPPGTSPMPMEPPFPR